jgi:hypothetical protein
MPRLIGCRCLSAVIAWAIAGDIAIAPMKDKSGKHPARPSSRFPPARPPPAATYPFLDLNMNGHPYVELPCQVMNHSHCHPMPSLSPFENAS